MLQYNKQFAKDTVSAHHYSRYACNYVNIYINACTIKPLFTSVWNEISIKYYVWKNEYMSKLIFLIKYN